MEPMKITTEIIIIFFAFSFSYAIDSHDFLNANYLPYTFMLESSLLDNTNTTTNENVTSNGDMSNALNTMRYHRGMINEYLCHNFIAKEILEELGLQGYTETDRLGIAAGVKQKKAPPIDRDELLDDVGSDGYKKWLAKSAILNDIYKRFDVQDDSDNSQLYASGEITGYAIQSDDKNERFNHETESKHNYGAFRPLSHNDGILNSASNSEFDVYNSAHDYGISQHGFSINPHSPITSGYGGQDHFHHTPPHHSFEPPAYHPHHHFEEEKGLALKDLFDLALTALAFLAFGMFILNLIMTCFAAQQGTTVVMQMNQDGNDNNKRSKRDSIIDNGKLNQLSYYVLNSIDALIMLQQDKTQEHCLKRALCESNKFSRSLPINQQIWVPVWSFGVSWISGNIFNQESRLENLRAIILGLGKANCKSIYAMCYRNNQHDEKKKKENG